MSNIIRFANFATSSARVGLEIDHEPHTDHLCEPYDCRKFTGHAVFATMKAYFDHNAGLGDYSPELVGSSVTLNNRAVYLSRSGTIDRIGMPLVTMLERHYSDLLNTPPSAGHL